MSGKHDTDAICALLPVSTYCAAAGIELKKRGAEMRAVCPFCGASSGWPLAVKSDDAGWRCNACNTGGDVIRLILHCEFDGKEDRIAEAIARGAALANLDSMSGAEIRDIAKKARERAQEAEARKVAERRAATLLAPDYWRGCEVRDEAGLEYLESRGVRAARQDVRFRPGRVCLPLYDEHGAIINVVSRRYAGEGGRLRSLKDCSTLGMFGKLADAGHTLGPVVLVEGVFDYLSARVLSPSSLVVGVHGCGNLEAVAEMIAPVARERGLVLVPHWSDQSHVGAKHAAKAIAKARALGVAKIQRMELTSGDLNDYLMAGGDVRGMLDAPVLDDPGARAIFPRTDLGNAQRFAAMFSNDFRFTVDAEVWRRWDGRRWDVASERVDLPRAVAAMTQSMARDADRDQDSGAQRWAHTSQASARISATIRLAAAEHALGAKQTDFDQSPLVFNAANGTVDLATGAIRPHRREDMLTQCSRVPYDGDAKAPRWLHFLGEVFRTNPEDAGFLQRFAGYSLTAATGAQVSIFLSGTGANGKGTVMRVLRAVMGSLCGSLPMELFRRKEIKRTTPEYLMGDLAGRRVALVSEGERGDVLDTSIFKDLTGEDVVNARFPAGRPFRFISVAKLWFASNYLPQIPPEDHATWRRVLLVPFHESFRDRMDPDLEPALMAELPGILAWMVRGARDWFENGRGLAGLAETDSMRAAKAEYRQFTDDLGQFLGELFTVSQPGLELKCRISVFYEKYQRWARMNGLDVKSSKAIGSEMKRRGLDGFRLRSDRYYPVGLNAPREES